MPLRCCLLYLHPNAKRHIPRREPSGLFSLRSMNPFRSPCLSRAFFVHASPAAAALAVSRRVRCGLSALQLLLGRAPRREGCRRSRLAPVARAHDFGSWARRADVGWSARASPLAGLGYVSQVPHLRVNLQILMHNLVIMGSFYMISHFYLIFKIGFAIFCLITASNTMGKMMYGHTMESIPFEVRPRARWWDR